jgi:hypothetical protein
MTPGCAASTSSSRTGISVDGGHPADHYFVKRSDNTHFASAMRKLNRLRARGPEIAEDFQDYFQRRFGTNPFRNLDTG